MKPDNHVPVIVLGIDAFSWAFAQNDLKACTSWDWLYESIDDGEATMSELRSYGFINRHGRRITDMEPHTGPEWANIYTGVTPEDHGITDQGWMEDSLDYAAIETQPIFEAFDRAGLRQIVLSMPVTWPSPQLENGYTVAGFPAPTDDDVDGRYNAPANNDDTVEDQLDYIASRPLNIADLRDSFDHSRTSLPAWGDEMTDEQFSEVVSNAIDCEQLRFSSAAMLAQTTQTDVLWVGTTNIDKVCHMQELSIHSDQVCSMYTAVGAYVKMLLEQVSFDHLFIVSDHGFEPGTRDHDHSGTIYYRGDDDDIHEFIDDHKMMTPDAATAISMATGVTGWIGDDRSQAYVDKREEQIVDRLRELGYL